MFGFVGTLSELSLDEFEFEFEDLNSVSSCFSFVEFLVWGFKRFFGGGDTCSLGSDSREFRFMNLHETFCIFAWEAVSCVEKFLSHTAPIKCSHEWYKICSKVH